MEIIRLNREQVKLLLEWFDSYEDRFKPAPEDIELEFLLKAALAGRDEEEE